MSTETNTNILGIDEESLLTPKHGFFKTIDISKDNIQEIIEAIENLPKQPAPNNVLKLLKSLFYDTEGVELKLVINSKKSSGYLIVQNTTGKDQNIAIRIFTIFDNHISSAIDTFYNGTNYRDAQASKDKTYDFQLLSDKDVKKFKYIFPERKVSKPLSELDPEEHGNLHIHIQLGNSPHHQQSNEENNSSVKEVPAEQTDSQTTQQLGNTAESDNTTSFTGKEIKPAQKKNVENNIFILKTISNELNLGLSTQQICEIAMHCQTYNLVSLFTNKLDKIKSSIKKSFSTDHSEIDKETLDKESTKLFLCLAIHSKIYKLQLREKDGIDRRQIFLDSYSSEYKSVFERFLHYIHDENNYSLEEFFKMIKKPIDQTTTSKSPVSSHKSTPDSTTNLNVATPPATDVHESTSNTIQEIPHSIEETNAQGVVDITEKPTEKDVERVEALLAIRLSLVQEENLARLRRTEIDNELVRIFLLNKQGGAEHDQK